MHGAIRDKIHFHKHICDILVRRHIAMINGCSHFVKMGNYHHQLCMIITTGGTENWSQGPNQCHGVQK